MSVVRLSRGHEIPHQGRNQDRDIKHPQDGLQRGQNTGQRRLGRNIAIAQRRERNQTEIDEPIEVVLLRNWRHAIKGSGD